MHLLALALLPLLPVLAKIPEKAININCDGFQGETKDRMCNHYAFPPANWPSKFPEKMHVMFANYVPLGQTKNAKQFFDQWSNTFTPEKKEDLIYPCHAGFVVENYQRRMKTETLQPKTLVDRFGDLEGHFLAPAFTDYEKRSISPNNLARDYHLLIVEKPLTVEAGPIEPWFEQPGMGLQYFLGKRSLKSLIEDGTLRELNLNTYLNEHKEIPRPADPKLQDYPVRSDDAQSCPKFNGPEHTTETACRCSLKGTVPTTSSALQVVSPSALQLVGSIILLAMM